MRTNIGTEQLEVAEKTLAELKKNSSGFPNFARQVKYTYWKLEDIRGQIDADGAITEESEYLIETLMKEVDELQEEFERIRN